MVNIDELRKKYNQLNRVPSEANSEFLKKFLMMEEGITAVRVLPWKDDSAEFYAETAIHRIDGRNHHCPKVKGDPCPLCEFGWEMWNTKETDKQEIARQVRAHKRFYLNAVERETGEVKILSMGIKLFSKILDCFFDEDYGDITNLKEGHDFKIVKDNQGQWPNYDKSAPKPTKTPAGSDAETAQWMDELHDIHNLVKVASCEDLKEIVLNVTGEQEAAKPVAAATQPTNDDDDGDYLSHLKGLGNE